MIQETLEQRIAQLEFELQELKDELKKDKRPWWEQIAGTFANDPIYLEAMKLGREYRDSTRPKLKKEEKEEKQWSCLIPT